MGCQKLTEVDNKGTLWTFYEKRLAAEAAADALGEEGKGYVAGISGGDDKPGFPTKHGRLGGLEKESTNLFRGCTVDANLSVLNSVIILTNNNHWKKIFLHSLILLCIIAWGPKELAEPTISLKKMVSASMLWKAPDQRRQETSAPKTQCHVIPCVLQHQSRLVALKKQGTKKK